MTTTLIQNETGGFTAFCPEVQGAISEGATKEDASLNLQDAVRGLMEMRKEMKIGGT